MSPQERLDKTRDALSESKKMNHKLTEQNQNLQRAREDLELKDHELEKHNQALKEVSDAPKGKSQCKAYDTN